MNFRRIKENYDTGLWSKKMVRDAVECGFITQDEYYIITNEMYKEVINVNSES